MIPVNERLLQFIWQHQYFNSAQLQTTHNQPLCIRYRGDLNTNQGPDFLQARIELDGIQLAGSIELHLRSSDWEVHAHSNDPHYKNVILHVVWHDDRPGETRFPVLELQHRVPVSLLEHYRLLMNRPDSIPCSSLQQQVPELVWQSWKERLVAERWTLRMEHIATLLQQTQQSWETVCWVVLARYFGLPHNADAFESVALSLPVTLLARHKHQIHQLEALLLGQAGLLEQNFEDAYPQMLQKEYRFLQHKYRLQPIDIKVQALRMRPGSFPAVRLAQLAMLVHQSSHLFSRLIESQSLNEIRNLLQVTANDFWHRHYTLTAESPFQPKQTGQQFINNLLINAVLPVLYAYAVHHQNTVLQEKALDWLMQIPAENNRIIRLWKQAHVHAQHAFDTQALLQLQKMYCLQRNCLACAIGTAILRKTVTAS
ncbi:MAG: DUF2851 family protein [Lacibacter sp.]